MNILKRDCPNCLSALLFEDCRDKPRTFCVVCSNPKTGKIRGWVWRWTWLHRILVVNKNFKQIEAENKRGKGEK
jgi:hypothetical protein